MTDLGMKMTDERYERLARSIRAAYAEASRDMEKKLADFTARHKAKDQIMRGKLTAGEITKQKYAVWQRGQVFIGKQWNGKVHQLHESLAHADDTAGKLIRAGQFDIFADNANYMNFRIDKDHGMTMNFGLYNPQSVSMLIDQQPELLPRRVIDGEKQEAWNTKIIANSVTQGIIQGESVQDISKRIARDTALTDEKAALRYARTACTAAQNAGRIQSMHDAQGMGIKVMKEWISVGDDRVRPGHEELDGEVIDVDEPFENEYGPIMYPGDPSADDENVWNCRCALGYYYPDHDRYSPQGYDSLEEEEFEEWMEE